MIPLGTITNDFHNTEVEVPIGLLSARTVARIRRTLCGMTDCKCGGNLSERGPQSVDIEMLDHSRARIANKIDLNITS